MVFPAYKIRNSQYKPIKATYIWEISPQKENYLYNFLCELSLK